MRKRILTPLVALVIALSVSACEEPTEPSASTEPSAYTGPRLVGNWTGSVQWDGDFVVTSNVSMTVASVAGEQLTGSMTITGHWSGSLDASWSRSFNIIDWSEPTSDPWECNWKGSLTLSADGRRLVGPVRYTGPWLSNVCLSRSGDMTLTKAN